MTRWLARWATWWLTPTYCRPEQRHNGWRQQDPRGHQVTFVIFDEIHHHVGTPLGVLTVEHPLTSEQTAALLASWKLAQRVHPAVLPIQRPQEPTT